jgi:hypothetical protein
MAVTLLGSATHTQGTGSASWTPSVTIPSSTTYVYVGIGSRLVSVDSMSLSGGGTGVQSVAINAGVAGQPIAQLWRIPNSTTGTQTLTVSLGGTVSGALAIYYLSDVDTTTPEVSTNSVDANASQPSLTMTTVVDGLVIDFASNYNNTVTGTGTPNGSQAEVLDVYVNQVTHVSSSVASASTSTSIGWTLTNNSNTAYVAVALQPTAGPPASTTPAFGRYGVRGPIR